MTFSVGRPRLRHRRPGHRGLLVHPRRRPGGAERACPGWGWSPCRRAAAGGSAHTLLRRSGRGRRAGGPGPPGGPRRRGRRPADRRPGRRGPGGGRHRAGLVPGQRPPRRRGLERAGQHAGLGRGAARRWRQAFAAARRRSGRPAPGGADRRPGRRRGPAWPAVRRAAGGQRRSRPPTRTTACGWTCGSTTPRDPVAQLRMLRNLQRAYDERDYETLALFAPEGARDLYAALAASRRGTATRPAPRWRRCARARGGRPGWPRWPATPASPRSPGCSTEQGGEVGSLGRGASAPFCRRTPRPSCRCREVGRR